MIAPGRVGTANRPVLGAKRQALAAGRRFAPDPIGKRSCKFQRIENRGLKLTISLRQEQIERLEERLCAVEHELTTRNIDSIDSDHQRSIPGPDSVTVETERSGPQLISTPFLYEGGSSFINQSIQARNVAQRTANSEGTGEQSGLNASLGHLNTLFQSRTTLSPLGDYHFSSTTARSVPVMDPLPLDLVIAILQEIKSKTTVLFKMTLIS